MALLLVGLVVPGATASDGCTITGTPGDDVLVGTDGSDVICGLGGDDRIHGGAGDDRLVGGSGNDHLIGGDGDDTLLGEAGDDLLLGNGGDDVLRGGNGDDRLVGGADDDDLAGENGRDELAGGSGADRVDGGNGPDRLLGGSGPDELAGGDGPDVLWAGTGDDALDGGRAPDECVGADGVNTYVACESRSDEPVPGSEDDTDLDTDGLPDELELVAGTDLLGADTDGDGLLDGQEYDTATDPTLRDTSGDGVADGLEDIDKDGLGAVEELRRGTDPLRADTDDDTLPDGAEVSSGTDPLVPDTDVDGLTDAQEPLLGTDPTDSDTDDDGISDGSETFDRTVADDATGAVFTAHGPGSAVLAVELDEPQDERLSSVPGQRGPPVDVLIPEPITSGTLTMRFDPATITPGAEVAILHFDEEAGSFDVPADQTIDLAAGTASVTTDTFSPFVLVQVGEFAEVWAAEITVPRAGGDGTGQAIDAAVVLDSSGSMTSTDPRGARRLAGKAFVDALLEGDKVAVVDFDSWATVLQALTDDFDAAKAAIDRVNSSGGTNIGAGLRAALDHLDAMGTEGRGRVVVLLTDGAGSYDHSLTTRAAASGTIVYTVGLGRSVPVALLTSIAEGTGGHYFQVDDADDLIDTFERIGGDIGAPDTDGDGVADVTEIGGARDGTGAVYYTDPNNPDTDGDGLTDGAELGELRQDGPYGARSYYEARSAPTRADSDYDGLDDWYETANTSWARKADYDRDGLRDRTELFDHETEPLSNDTDTDGFTDDWELDNADAGFDPGIYDVRMEWWEYAGDFSRGALCGDADFWAFCESTSWAFVSGALAAGFVGVGDVRDALAGLAKGDLVSAGLSVVALVPYVGDSVSVVAKLVKHLKHTLGGAGLRAAALPTTGPSTLSFNTTRALPNPAASASALRSVAKMTSVPAWVRIKALDEAFDGAATALKGQGLTDDAILAFARRGMSPKHVKEMFDSAADVVRKNEGTFTKEVDAENLLRADLETVRELTLITGRPGVINGGSIKRFHDITSITDRTAFEVKFGKVTNGGRARSQATKDSEYLELPDTALDEIEWHFFANRHGVFGPDEDLLKHLNDLGIPYVLHLP